MNDTALLPDRTPQRVRHTLRFRELTVQAVQRVTPHLVRITLGGDALEGFTSPGFDDHMKLFFPDEATGALTLSAARIERAVRSSKCGSKLHGVFRLSARTPHPAKYDFVVSMRKTCVWPSDVLDI